MRCRHQQTIYITIQDVANSKKDLKTMIGGRGNIGVGLSFNFKLLQ